MQHLDPRRDEHLSAAASPFVRFLSFLVLLACGIIALVALIGVVEQFKTIVQLSGWVLLVVVSLGALVVFGGAGYWIALRIRHAEEELQARRAARKQAQEWHEAAIER